MPTNSQLAAPRAAETHRAGDQSAIAAMREHDLTRVLRSAESKLTRRAAMTELLRRHASLVANIASRYVRPGIGLPDLIAAGYIGLHEAIDRFEPDDPAAHLADAALGWVRWHIQHFIDRNARPLPRARIAAHRQLARMEKRLRGAARHACMREGVEPADTELNQRVGARIGLPAAAVAREPRTDAVAQVALPAVVARFDHAATRRRLARLAESVLGARERIVYAARCLPAPDDATPVTALAMRLGVTPDRVARIEASARSKLDTAAWVEGIRDFPAMAARPRAHSA